MSNWYQPNGGPHQNGGHHPSQPPNPYGQMQNNPQNMNQVAPYAALGGAAANVSNNTQASAYGIPGGAAQNAQYYATGHPNNNQGFSYSTLGTYGAMGSGGQVQSAGNYAAMGSVAAPASAYGNMAAADSGGNAQQVVWPWNANPPQHQQLQYSQQGYPGYGQIQAAAMPYNANAPSSSSFQPEQQQPQHLQVAIPPPPPPPPASYLDKDGMQGELAASARRERMATREDVPKKPPPPAPRPPPAPNPPTPNVPANVMLTDSAVSAISALSSLDQRWSAKEVAKKERRRAKRKRQRSRKKKNAANKEGSSDAAGAAEPGEVWIDVDHGPSNKKQQQGNGFDLAAGVESDSFPPLAPAKSSGEEDEGDVARLASMEGMSTSQLTSYAAVLGRALDQNSQDATIPGDDNDEEMDISEDDEEDISSGDGPPADAPTSPTLINDDATEKEQRALKLAELRAKAKLARAKLRVAEQKKARGSAARDSLDSTKDGGSSLLSVATRPSFMSTSMYSTTGLAPPVKAAITAMRNLESLVIEDVSATGPGDEVRFVDSVYRQQMPGGDRTILVSTSKAPARTGISPPPASVAEENRKKSETLKQQLHLARLQLEIKKKELQKKELEKNKKGALPVNEDPNQEDEPESAVDLNESDPADRQELQPDAIQPADDTPSAEQAHAKLEELRRRQKELKQKNDIASLRNIVHRQRDLLQAQGRELSESSSQLQSCLDNIKSKQQLLEKSDQKLEELHHRKRIMEGMVFRATEQLMAARKALNERRQGKSG
ncbi:hypothetical protein ACHAXT_007499 [Thalassiosira profunda]